MDEEVRGERLPRYTVPMDEQEDFESVKLWRHVSEAIDNEDQHAATEQKSILEETQRAGARERKANEQIWQPRFFELVSPLNDNKTRFLFQFKRFPKEFKHYFKIVYLLGSVNRTICL